MNALDRLRKICLALPDTNEKMSWGEPHFRVCEKIFCGFGNEDGKMMIGMKLEMEHADILVRNDPRFRRAKYVGHKGWVSLDASTVTDWNEVRALVLESYRLIAPKKSLAKLEPTAAASSPPPRRRTKAG